MDNDEQLADAQALAKHQGDAFEDAVAVLLRCAGWSIDERHARFAGTEVDLVATDPDGVQWWIECKGSWRGRTPGSRRSDTVKKALGVAWWLARLPDRRPYMLVTSHLPPPASSSGRMLAGAIEDGLFDAVVATSVAFPTTPTLDLDDDEGDVDEQLDAGDAEGDQ